MVLFPHCNNDKPPFNFSLSPVLLQFRTLLGSLWISQLCWRQSPSASMPPALRVFVSSRYRPWKNGRQKNRIRTRNSLLAWGSMLFGPQSAHLHLQEKNSFFFQKTEYEKLLFILLAHFNPWLSGWSTKCVRYTAYIYSTRRLTLHRLSNES